MTPGLCEEDSDADIYPGSCRIPGYSQFVSSADPDREAASASDFIDLGPQSGLRHFLVVCRFDARPESFAHSIRRDELLTRGYWTSLTFPSLKVTLRSGYT